VGGGPFPSELLDERGERLRQVGNEFGTVTGRPRRCGWFDAVAGRYAAQLNGLSSVAITKLDVLSGFDPIGIVTGYRLANKPVSFSAAGSDGLTVQVEEVEGWREPLEEIRRLEDLPPAAQRYVTRIAELLDVPVALVSVGPERRQLARA
jgi:adenylosuccinate synthase